MLVQEAAKRPLRWSSSQAASYIIQKKDEKEKESSHALLVCIMI